MNSAYYRQKVQSHQQEIAKLQHQKGQEAARVADFQKRSNEASAKTGRSSTPSSIQSYLRDAQRYSEQAATTQKKLASIEEKIAREHARLVEAQTNVAREEKREADHRHREEQQRVRDHEKRMRNINSTLVQHDALHRHTISAIEKLAHLPERITVVFMAANPLDQAQLRLDEVTKEAIVQTMAAASGEIRLVFFNTCYSRNQAEAVVKHIHAAIGMKTSIRDNAA